MYEVNCYDLSGNTINNFFQWDVDQKIVIKVKGCDENYLSIKPEVHFSNMKREEALVVRSDSELSDSETIVADVPNILLQEPYPLLVYVYLTDSDDVSSQKTILYTELPVRKRQKPSDYLYVENITRITAEIIKKEIEASTKEARTSAIEDITDTNNNAKESISDAKTDFETTCNNIISEAESIKQNTQNTYDATVIAAEQTQTKIENEINTMMLENGLLLKTVDDGYGNVSLSIVIAQE